jgi:dihydrofolate reductase
MIRMILAVDRGNAIGWSDGRLAYSGLKKDLTRFKEMTTGQTVVMGYNTFKSLNRPNGLPNRKNIVVTSKNPLSLRDEIGQDVDIISDIKWIIRQNSGSITVADSTPKTAPDFWIIGGARVYNDLICCEAVDEIYLTLIDSTCDADIRLSHDLANWKLFVLQQRKIGIRWDVELGTSQLDGSHFTTYITLRKI